MKSAMSGLWAIFGIGFIAIGLVARLEEKKIEPIVDEPEGVEARTTVRLKNEFQQSITLIMSEPRQGEMVIEPGDIRKMASISRSLIRSKEKEFSWRGTLIMPNARRINIHILYKDGYLAFSILDSVKTETQDDLYVVQKPKGEIIKIFYNKYELNIKFYPLAKNVGFHEIFLTVGPKKRKVVKPSETRLMTKEALLKVD